MDKKCVAENAQLNEDAGSPPIPMILLLLVLFLILPAAGGLAVMSVARRAPRGRQDEEGFHLIAAHEEADLPDPGPNSSSKDCGIGHVAADGHT